MLVSMTNILHEAEKGGYAVLGLDFLTIQMLKLELQVAEQHNAPVIISYPSLPIDKFRRFKTFTRRALDLCDKARVPVCLHLDHGKSVNACKQAIDAGFSSVMIDGSALTFEENVRVTKIIVHAARQKNISVEAEIGHVGSGKGTVELGKDESMMTDPEEAKRFAELTGVDCLAVSVGTIHGEYKGEPKIDFDRLKEIKKHVPVPLVLHGGSGTGDENIKRAVKEGIRKINLFTEFLKPYVAVTKRFYLSNPLRVLRPNGKSELQAAAIEPVLRHYFSLSGSIERGSF